MIKVWFNKNYASIGELFRILKGKDVDIFYTHTLNVDYAIEANHFSLEPIEDEGYVEFCLDFCKKNNIDVFYPWRNLKTIYRERHLFEKARVNVFFACSDQDFNTIDNKVSFYDALDKDQFNIPAYFIVKTKADLIEKYTQLNLSSQVCIKPCVSVYAAGFKIIHNDEDYDHWLAMIHGHDKYDISYSSLLHIMPENFDKDMMLLQFLPGDEYSHDIFCHNGKIVDGVVRKKLNETDKYQVLMPHKEIEEFSDKLVSKFNLSGFINIQYRDAANGVPYILEINPRISGGLPRCFFSGIDYAQLFIKTLNREKIEKVEIKDNILVYDKLTFKAA